MTVSPTADIAAHRAPHPLTNLSVNSTAITPTFCNLFGWRSPPAPLHRYITYCRTKCSPRLSPSAAELLKDHYVKVRQTIVGAQRDQDAPAPAIPITVRQLESLTRLSEALAKMRYVPRNSKSGRQDASACKTTRVVC